MSDDSRYGALAPIARTGWALSMTRPVSAFERELLAPLIGDAAIVLGTLLAAALIAGFVANRLARPLRQLSRSAAAIGRGDRPVIPLLAGGAEVEQLSSAMRSMQAAVAHREDDLRLLATASERLTVSLEYTETLHTAADVAVPDFADWCVVDVVEAGRVTRAAVAQADPATEALAQRLHETYPPDVTSSRGPIGRVVASGHEEWSGNTSDEFFRSYICAPLIVGGQVRGTILFITRRRVASIPSALASLASSRDASRSAREARLTEVVNPSGHATTPLRRRP